MADVIFRPAAEGDIALLAANLRQVDRDEITASSGPDILRAIRHSVAVSPDAFACVSPDGLVALGGMAPLCLLTGSASPWLLGTDLLDTMPSKLTRTAMAFCTRHAGTYPLQVNYVDARNVRSVRWLRRLGFTIHPAAPHGVAGLPFHRFEKDFTHV